MLNAPNSLVYTCVALACFSTILSGVVIWAHFKIPQLHKHPGQMIVIICLIQMISDLNWIAVLKTIREYFLCSEGVKTGTCKYFAIVFNILVFTSWNVLFCLILELVIKIKKPFSTNYMIRNKIYTILTICFTTAEFLPILHFWDFGLTVAGTCYIRDGATSYWFVLIPVFFNVPCNLIGLIILRFSEGYNKNKPLQKMVRTCFCMCITWGFTTFTGGMMSTFGTENKTMIYIAFVLGSSAGIVLATCRLGSVEIMKKLYRSTFKKMEKSNEMEFKHSKAVNEVLVEDCSVNFLFKELTEESFKEILYVFSLCLASTSNTNENYSYSYRKLKHVFSKDSLNDLSRSINFTSFQVKKDHGIWEYGKNYFDSIRESCNVTSEILLNSFSLIPNLPCLKNANTAGRSGAFIMMTFDKKFVLKVLNRKERYLLLDLLPAYSKRICESSDSRIVRILGMYKIRSNKQTFIIMENIVTCKDKAMLFDLKGSIDDRYVGTNSVLKASVLKDGNFLEMNKTISLNSEQRDVILKALNEDFRFFMKNNIIDYSLLIAIYEEPIEKTSRYYIDVPNGLGYSFGIIDFLQVYSFKKKLELFCKRLKGKANTSVCSPRKYSKRLLSFLSDLFQVVTD